LNGIRVASFQNEFITRYFIRIVFRFAEKCVYTGGFINELKRIAYTKRRMDLNPFCSDKNRWVYCRSLVFCRSRRASGKDKDKDKDKEKQ